MHHTVFQSLAVHMVLLVTTKIQVKSSRGRKWRVTWALLVSPLKTLKLCDDAEEGLILIRGAIPGSKGVGDGGDALKAVRPDDAPFPAGLLEDAIAAAPVEEAPAEEAPAEEAVADDIDEEAVIASRRSIFR